MTMKDRLSATSAVESDGCVNDDDRLLTVPEVAALLQMSPGGVYHLISQRRIPTVHISSRCVRFRRSALLAWIESLTQEAK